LTPKDGVEFTCVRDQRSPSTAIPQFLIVTKYYRETLHSNDQAGAGLLKN